MGIAIALLLLALLVGGISLIIEALWWLIIIALVIAVAGAIAGWLGRSPTGSDDAPRGDASR